MTVEAATLVLNHRMDDELVAELDEVIAEFPRKYRSRAQLLEIIVDEWLEANWRESDDEDDDEEDSE